MAETPSQSIGLCFTVGLCWPDGPRWSLTVRPGRAGPGRGRGSGGRRPGRDLAGRPCQPLRAPVRWVGRCATDAEGRWAIRTFKPGPLPALDGGVEAPHLEVLVFARGLLGRLVTRISFPDEVEANAGDPLLCSIPDPARARLVAVAGGTVPLRHPGAGCQQTPFLAL